MFEDLGLKHKVIQQIEVSMPDEWPASHSDRIWTCVPCSHDPLVPLIVTLKQEHLPPHAVFASNTSAIPIARIAEASKVRSRRNRLHAPFV